MAQINESIIKTPGVYVNEIPLFPPSVAQVETAIPAFIGYTEKADNFLKDDLLLVPKKIRSMSDFREKFGGGPPVNIKKIVLNTNNDVEKVELEDRFYLYNCLRLFYSNGGGECYIVSVGKYDEVKLGESDNENKIGLLTGLDKIRKIDEPTILIAPDAQALPNENDCHDMYKQMLKQCNELQDRFAIFDIKEKEKNSLESNVLAFRKGIGINNLNYGAAYTPWLHTNISRTVRYNDVREKLIKKDGVQIKIMDIFNDLGEIEYSEIAKRLENLSDDLNKIEELFDGSNLNYNDLHLRSSLNEIKFLDTFSDIESPIPENGNLVEIGKDQIFNKLKNLLTSYINKIDYIFSIILSEDDEGLKDRSESGDDEDYLHDYLKLVILPRAMGIGGKILSMKNEIEEIFGDVDLEIDSNIEEQIDKYFDGSFPSWYNKEEESEGDNPDDGETDTNDPDGETDTSDPDEDGSENNNEIQFLNKLIEYKEDITTWGNTLREDVLEITNSSKNLLTTYENSALKSINILKNIYRAVETKILTLPPSAAIAGVYASVDRSRGVWKAPANVSLNNVVALTQSIDNRMQDGLNVDVNGGKSINVIREFHGKGYLVWGARTLSGNDNEWRYINVRRFFIMVEQSAKKATMQFVFEANDANTWVKVRAMIENYLTVLWRQGALAGAKPEHAFYVRCGLNQTMGPQDILEGRMIVEIGLAAVRPAEFIILRFSHKLQES